MNKLVFCVLLALMVVTINSADVQGKPDVSAKRNTSVTAKPVAGASTVTVPLLLQVGMTMVPALLYKLL
ncbi:hypothetical protein MATL_G00125880 [Megalops atlanticus]|uniref:Uncharacterized protein n=1 Tax=Megalops atlanticus TaxID=7932 RepID=A0A9D3PWU4_MEGAT|nr:hypothetical protein MATL_G00125880 [Megalops atlanticus]